MERLTTGIRGLDLVLHGGFLRGGISMVMGRPGCGKTTFGNQVAFHEVRQGGRALYVTLLAESHARMLAHLEGFSWFDGARIGEAISYVSAYNELERGRLDGLLEVLRVSIRRHEATLVVIDGLPTAGAMADSEIALKRFVHELQVLVELLGCTCLLLTGANDPDGHYPERTMVDGLVQLSMTARGMRVVRELEVVKLRGSAQLLGRHLYEIGADGLVLHPRLESRRARGPQDPAAVGAGEQRPLLSTGVSELDALMGGGLAAGTTTLVKGPPGSGKSMLGLTFLHAGARAGEPGLHLGFVEPPARVLSRSEHVGLSLRGAVAAGQVELLWEQSREPLADAVATRLLEAVERRRPRRLVIDGLGGLMNALVYAERAGEFFGALASELRALGVATLITSEARDLVGAEVEVPVSGISAIVDNVVYLRWVERRSHIHRLINVLKVSERGYDGSLREMRITDRGIVVAPDGEGADAALSDVLRTSARGAGAPAGDGSPDAPSRRPRRRKGGDPDRRPRGDRA